MPGFKAKGTRVDKKVEKKEKAAKKQRGGGVSFFSKKEKKPKQEEVSNQKPVTEPMQDMIGDLTPMPHFKNSLQIAGSAGSGELKGIFEHFISSGELHPLIEDRAVGAFDAQNSSGKVQVNIL